MKVLNANVSVPAATPPYECVPPNRANRLFAAWFSAALLVSAVAGSGCAHFPVNAPLGASGASGYRFCYSTSPTNSEELLLLLAFSGGGMRATAVSYGVLEELVRTQVGRPGQRHPLLEEVDAISAVSGGTFTAACYALWGKRIFSDFEKQFLKRPIQNALLLRALTPRSRIRLASPTFNLSDLAAEYYDRLLFKGATYRDLAALPRRPFLLINATDLSLGERFEFTQDQFDLIGSDLSQLPLSRAVAAALAFPVMLSPIVLKNYSAACSRPEPPWIGDTLADPSASARQKSRAQAARSYGTNAQPRAFIHLLDGGIADNQGLRGLMEGVLERAAECEGSTQPATRKIRRIAIINVDADTGAELDLDASEQAPPVQDVLTRVLLTMLRRYSFETVELFRESAQRAARGNEAARHEGGAGQAPSSSPLVPPLSNLYFVELHFGRLAKATDRQFFNSVPTRLQLPSKSVDRLVLLARSELAQNREFRRLVEDLRESRAAEARHTSTEGKGGSEARRWSIGVME
jgi:NTE family protein